MVGTCPSTSSDLAGTDRTCAALHFTVYYTFQTKYVELWRGVRRRFGGIPAAGVHSKGSLDGSMEPSGMWEEAHHPIVQQQLFWEQAEHVWDKALPSHVVNEDDRQPRVWMPLLCRAFNDTNGCLHGESEARTLPRTCLSIPFYKVRLAVWLNSSCWLA